MPYITMAVSNPMLYDRRVSAQARTLSQAGYKVTVVAAAAPNLAREEWRDGYNILRSLPPYPRGLRRFVQLLSPGDLLRYGSKPGAVLNKALLEIGGDVFHLHDLDTLACGALAARQLGVKYVYDSHELFLAELLGDRRQGSFSYGCIRRIRRWLWARLERKYIVGASCVFASNASLARALAFLYPNAPRPLPLLNCPENQLRVKPGADLSQIKERPDQVLIVYHGILGIGRGTDTIFRALTLLEDRYLLCLLGAEIGPGLEEVLQHAKSLGVDHRIHVVPPVLSDQVVSTIATADIGLVPIEPVNFNKRLAKPNKLLECLLAGLPIVGTTLPEIRNILKQVHPQGLYAPYDANGLARAIRATPTGQSAQILREDTRNLALSEYTWQNQAQVLLKAYDTLLGGPA